MSRLLFDSFDSAPMPPDIVVSMESREDAIWNWVVASSGVSPGSVLWTDQLQGRPPGQWISLDMMGIEQVGQDWLDTHDAVPSAPGLEIEQAARGVRKLTVSIQCFAGPALGSSSAFAVLNTLVSRARLESQQLILRNGGLGFSRFTAITAISDVLDTTRIEPRAIVHAVLYMANEVVEQSTYISRVNITDQIPTPPQTVTINGP
jgi:hypothetical protein